MNAFQTHLRCQKVLSFTSSLDANCHTYILVYLVITVFEQMAQAVKSWLQFLVLQPLGVNADLQVKASCALAHQCIQSKSVSAATF